MFDIITIGDAILDTFLVLENASMKKGTRRCDDQLCLNFADKIPISHSVQSVGGNAANVAAATNKLGLKTAIVTEVGNDINGRIIADKLACAGIETKFVKTNKGQETRYSIVLNYKSERTILSCYPKRNYTLPKLEKTKWIYYTSLGKGFESLQAKLIDYLKKYPETKLAMNPGSYQMKFGLKEIKRMLPLVDVLLLNKEEAERLVGKRNTVEKLLNTIQNKTKGVVVITDSIRGSYTTDGKKTLFMKIYPIKPLAKTGAGDAYTGGFLSAIILGKNLETAMEWGTANAGGVIQEFGAQRGLLSKIKLLQSIKRYKKTKPTHI
ncbi:MAG: carbohydrate kinase family protein [Candidatus Magasanikbacteria bacterium]